MFRRVKFGERHSRCGRYVIVGPSGRGVGEKYRLRHRPDERWNGGGYYPNALGYFATVAEAKEAAQDHRWNRTP